MLGLMHDHPYVFTPTIAKIMLPVWVCLLVSTVRAIRRDMKKEKAPLGLYIHIPFCRQKCAYCDFYSLPSREDKWTRTPTR